MPSATDSNATTHIPAWKRLGLKLKSAQTTPDVAVTPLKDQDTSKRKRDNPIESETPSKKLKKAAQSVESIHPAPTTPQLGRKKSVTFTDETKAEDGDSIKQLYNSWFAEQQAQDPSFELKTSQPVFQTPEPSKVEEEVPSNLDEKERRVKRVKKTKEEKSKGTPKPKKPSKIANIVPKPTIASRPFLEYLAQYCEARESWKFNKNHQIHLLKHAFNIEIVPSSHAHFLYEYVRGLQGGVRTRLRDTALSIKVKDIDDGAAGFGENMAEREREQRQIEYERAMRKYVDIMTAAASHEGVGAEKEALRSFPNETAQVRAAKRMRAERILAELAASPDHTGSSSKAVNGDDESQKRLRMNDGSTRKVGRKRNQRTTVDVDDSSSDDSSDSDSSSSDDSTADNEGPDADDTSSSSSSSSSESSEDSSESDSSEDDESDSN